METPSFSQKKKKRVEMETHFLLDKAKLEDRAYSFCQGPFSIESYSTLVKFIFWKSIRYDEYCSK
jgi:hypothetical protein